jgi:hypothetical protein
MEQAVSLMTGALGTTTDARQAVASEIDES